jgi:drug/metabolite transporter (DMT)-like permease
MEEGGVVVPPVRTRVLVLVSVIGNVVGNFLLSRGMHDIGELVTFSPLPYLRALLNPWVLCGVFLLIAWIIAQLSLLSRADLTYVLPVTAASYVGSAILGFLLLGEWISPARWGGILLITAGVVLVGATAPRTAGRHPVVLPPAIVDLPLLDERTKGGPHAHQRHPGAHK